MRTLTLMRLCSLLGAAAPFVSCQPSHWVPPVRDCRCSGAREMSVALDPLSFAWCGCCGWVGWVGACGLRAVVCLVAAAAHPLVPEYPFGLALVRLLVLLLVLLVFPRPGGQAYDPTSLEGSVSLWVLPLQYPGPALAAHCCGWLALRSQFMSASLLAAEGPAATPSTNRHGMAHVSCSCPVNGRYPWLVPKLSGCCCHFQERVLPCAYWHPFGGHGQALSAPLGVFPGDPLMCGHRALKLLAGGLLLRCCLLLPQLGCLRLRRCRLLVADTPL